MPAAGGIGITALVGTGTALKAHGADYRFVCGARSRELMAFVDQPTDEHGDRLDPRVADDGGRTDVDELVGGQRRSRRGAPRLRAQLQCCVSRVVSARTGGLPGADDGRPR